MADIGLAHAARQDNHTFTVEIMRVNGSKLASLVIVAPDAAAAWYRAGETIGGYPNLYPGKVCPIVQASGRWRVGGSIARSLIPLAIGLWLIAAGAAAAVLKVAEGVQAEVAQLSD